MGEPAADAQVNVNLDLRAGYVIDLRDRADRGPLPNVDRDGPGGTIVDAKAAE